MRYSSTRGGGKKNFDEVIYAGLAPDGGLYEPLRWPSKRPLRKLLSHNAPFASIVGEVLRLFAEPKFKDIDFTEIAQQAFSNFNSAAIIPLREVEKNLWLLELFHGPTLSFKDIPLQVYARLLGRIAQRRKRLLIMIGATSGDTGSAAIEALQHIRGLRLFMLHPRGRISDLQRKQMTCNKAPHICNIAVDGSYDDCLRLAKAMFSSEEIQARGEIGAVNSFNWVRIAVQSAVYLYAANQLPKKAKRIRFALASGNFGNAYAGYVAKKLGAPIENISLAVSKNDCLHQFFAKGSIKVDEVVPSLTPSIDIMTPNNLERLIFRILGGSARRWCKLREKSVANQAISISKSAMRTGTFKFFHSSRFDDEQIIEAIVQAYHSLGAPVDPHSAIALAAAKQSRNMDTKNKGNKDIPTIAFATASAAKFPETIERAIGARPHIPLKLDELNNQYEEYESIPAEEAKLEELIVKRLRTPLDSDANHIEEGKQQEEQKDTSEGSIVATDTQEATTLPIEKKEPIFADTKATEEKRIDATGGIVSLPTSFSPPPIPPAPTGFSPPPTSPSPASFSPPPASPPPALSAATPDEGELERKIAKLKEQTAQLDKTLDASIIRAATEATVAMPPLPATEDSELAKTVESEANYTTQSLQEKQQEILQETPSSIVAPAPLEEEKKLLEKPAAAPLATAENRDDAENIVFGSKTDENINTSIESPPKEQTSDNEIENLAQAAEEGQASLEDKIAKLKEQSALLDAATEQTRQSLSQEGMEAFPSFSSDRVTSSISETTPFSAQGVAAQEPTAQVDSEHKIQDEQEEQGEQQKEPIIAGASPFFASASTSNLNTPSPAEPTEQTASVNEVALDKGTNENKD